jgi:hypothetical protein
VGLVLHAARQRGPARVIKATNGDGRMFGRLRHWFREFAHGG